MSYLLGLVSIRRAKKKKTTDRYVSRASRLIVNVIVYNYNGYIVVIVYVIETIILYRMYHETMSF